MRNFEGELSCYEDRTTKNIEYRTNTEGIAYYYLIILSMSHNLHLHFGFRSYGIINVPISHNDSTGVTGYAIFATYYFCNNCCSVSLVIKNLKCIGCSVPMIKYIKLAENSF